MGQFRDFPTVLNYRLATRRDMLAQFG
jgi:hypothetical protein